VHYLGLSEDENLFEAAGCLLRLAAWPTEYEIRKLVDILSEEYVQLPGLLKLGLDQPPQRDRSLRKERTKIQRKDMLAADTLYSLARQHFVQSDSLPFTVVLHFRCGDSYPNEESSQCEHDPKRNPKDESERMMEGTPVSIGTCANRILRSFASFSDTLMSMSSRTYSPGHSTIVHIATTTQFLLDRLNHTLDSMDSRSTCF
jgi:hypothetical protein